MGNLGVSDAGRGLMFSLHIAFYILRLSLSTCFEYSGPYRIVHSLTENRKA